MLTHTISKISSLFTGSQNQTQNIEMDTNTDNNLFSFMPLSLQEYDVNLQSGFLPSEEIPRRLSDNYYSPWEDLLADIVHHQLSGQFRERILELPILSTDRLVGLREYQRACVVLSFLAHAYVWGHHQPALELLPKNLAIPWCQVSEHVGISPILTNATVVLWNWRFLNNNNSIDLNNICTHSTFTGSPDESWFYLVSVAIEARGGQSLRNIGSMINASTNNDINGVANGLIGLSQNIKEMTHLLNRMYEKNDPFMFYWKIRRYLAGWENMKDAGLENGVIYQDAKVVDSFGVQDPVMNMYKKYSGGSAAQSSVIQIMDIALGIKHYPTDEGLSEDFSSQANSTNNSKNGSSVSLNSDLSHVSEFDRPEGNPYLIRMRDYMPRSHRQFLIDLAKFAKIREYVLLNTRDVSRPNKSEFSESIDLVDDALEFKTSTIQHSLQDQINLIKSYNKCVSMLKTFRDAHIKIVTVYVVEQARNPPKSSPTLNSLKNNQEKTQQRPDTPQTNNSHEKTVPNSSFVVETVVPEIQNNKPQTQSRESTQEKAPNYASGLAQAVDDDKAVLGTGGTDAIAFLKLIRDETVATRICT
ncbi:hypothetical protein BB559_001312 [Furculomyces boomerangus]|uniref:Indoleamine 2,3-dioxygenase n=1 Tax=Furculomyces boomerangus TaxID=61424 RepID=A0A2T9Z2D9_9FUNG|nr:hypothetical protein BB559_001312 [Furculomyces boomerangus]